VQERLQVLLGDLKGLALEVGSLVVRADELDGHGDDRLPVGAEGELPGVRHEVVRPHGGLRDGRAVHEGLHHYQVLAGFLNALARCCVPHQDARVEVKVAVKERNTIPVGVRVVCALRCFFCARKGLRKVKSSGASRARSVCFIYQVPRIAANFLMSAKCAPENL